MTLKRANRLEPVLVSNGLAYKHAGIVPPVFRRWNHYAEPGKAKLIRCKNLVGMNASTDNIPAVYDVPYHVPSFGRLRRVPFHGHL